MLIKFAVNGYLSIGDKCELFLIPTSHARIKNTRFESNFLVTPKYKIMKSCVLFGNNATGKTNILRSIRACVGIVSKGLDLTTMPKETLDRFNYFIDKKEIAFDLAIYNEKKDCDYEYYLRFSKDEVIEESLTVNGDKVFEFDERKLKIFKNVKSKNEVETLFSAKSTETLLKKLVDTLPCEVGGLREATGSIRINIADGVEILPRETMLTIDEKEKNDWEKHKKHIIAILQEFDNTIKNIAIEPLGAKRYELLLQRNGFKGKFHMGVESNGIRKIMTHMRNIIVTMQEGGSIIIDELDSSISTKTLLRLINSYVNSKENKGQFIITSHNPMLLNKNILNPEQMYIVNKTEYLTTTITPVSDFHTRNDKNKLYEDFLKGRFNE